MPRRKKLYIYPNKSSRVVARRALDRRKKLPRSKRGGLDAQQAHEQGIGSGVMRARDIAAGKRINAYQVKAFFDRHRGNYTKARADGKKWEDSKAWQAWDLWGGEPLRKQVEAAVKKDRKENPAEPTRMTRARIAAFKAKTRVGKLSGADMRSLKDTRTRLEGAYDSAGLYTGDDPQKEREEISKYLREVDLLLHGAGRKKNPYRPRANLTAYLDPETIKFRRTGRVHIYHRAKATKRFEADAVGIDSEGRTFRVNFMVLGHDMTKQEMKRWRMNGLGQLNWIVNDGGADRTVGIARKEYRTATHAMSEAKKLLDWKFEEDSTAKGGNWVPARFSKGGIVGDLRSKNPMGARELIKQCRAHWEHYCERPNKTRLKAILKHLEVMKGSKAKSVKEERSRCLRAANREKKKYGL